MLEEQRAASTPRILRNRRFLCAHSVRHTVIVLPTGKDTVVAKVRGEHFHCGAVVTGRIAVQCLKAVDTPGLSSSSGARYDAVCESLGCSPFLGSPHRMPGKIRPGARSLLRRLLLLLLVTQQILDLLKRVLHSRSLLRLRLIPGLPAQEILK
jgi:hypothetical protein